MNITSDSKIFVAAIDSHNAWIGYIENLSPFYQSIIGAFVFSVLVMILRSLLSFLRSTGKSALKFWGMSRLAKYYVHKKMVTSTGNLCFLVFGNFLIIREFLKALSIGVLIIVFYLGVKSLIAKEYFSFISYFFAFNSFYEAYDWVKDHSSDNSIANVDDALKNEFLKKFNIDDKQKS